MELDGEIYLPLQRQRVWAGLNDPETLKACIHSCEQLAWVSPDTLAATVAVKVAITKVRFNGTIRLSDVRPAESYTLHGEGRGLIGLATGRADVSLHDEGDGTRLRYFATAAAGGKLAELGQQWIEKAGHKLVDRFFQRFIAQIEAGEL